MKVLSTGATRRRLLWPRRAAFETARDPQRRPSSPGVWGEDETIGWVYQYFNGQDERRKMREESQAPRNSRELAVRNQFFTPRYVVQFLTDNTLGRIWYEMRGTRHGARRAMRVHGPQARRGRSRRGRRRIRATCACSTPPAAAGTSCSTPSTCCSRSTRRRRPTGRARRARRRAARSREDYPSLEALRRPFPA